MLDGSTARQPRLVIKAVVDQRISEVLAGLSEQPGELDGVAVIQRGSHGFVIRGGQVAQQLREQGRAGEQRSLSGLDGFCSLAAGDRRVFLVVVLASR